MVAPAFTLITPTMIGPLMSNGSAQSATAKNLKVLNRQKRIAPQGTNIPMKIRTQGRSGVSGAAENARVSVIAKENPAGIGGNVRKNQPEQQIHKAVVQHLRQRGMPGIVYFHVPNGAHMGGRRGRVQGGIGKGMGVRAGVSDLILVREGHVYALELKAGDKSRPTVDQMQFASDMNAAGGHAVICHDLDRALRCLESWGFLRGRAA